MISSALCFYTAEVFAVTSTVHSSYLIFCCFLEHFVLTIFFLFLTWDNMGDSRNRLKRSLYTLACWDFGLWVWPVLKVSNLHRLGWNACSFPEGSHIQSGAICPLHRPAIATACPQGGINEPFSHVKRLKDQALIVMPHTPKRYKVACWSICILVVPAEIYKTFQIWEWNKSKRKLCAMAIHTVVNHSVSCS